LSAREVVDKSGWLSRWPDYFPRSNRDRTLSFLVDDILTISGEEPQQFVVNDYWHLKVLMFRFNLDVYVQKFLGKNGFRWIDNAVRDDKASINLANASRSIVSISIKGPHNSVRKIVASSAWGWRKQPTMDFIHALQEVFDSFDYGVHPSPGSLGANSVKTIIGAELDGKRYTRPGNPLRRVLLDYGCGGRADEFDEPREYEDAFTFDYDNFYARKALLGVPAGRPEETGLYADFVVDDLAWSEDITILDEYATAFCQVKVTVPDNISVAPFYIRNADGSLHWITEPGVYFWWHWKQMIECMLHAGCKVEIGHIYGWRELDTFLEAFITRSLNLRYRLKYEKKKLQESMVKQMIVSTFGSFGMRPFVLNWFRVKGGRKEIYPSLILRVCQEKDYLPITSYIQ